MTKSPTHSRATYRPAADLIRSASQWVVILDFLLGNARRHPTRAFTASEVREGTSFHYELSSMGSRIRDLRKPQYGGYEVVSKRREGGRVWEYRVILGSEGANVDDREALTQRLVTMPGAKEIIQTLALRVSLPKLRLAVQELAARPDARKRVSPKHKGHPGLPLTASESVNENAPVR